MANWQYKGSLPVNRGYYVTGNKKSAQPGNSTGYLEINGQRVDLWIYNIEMDFQIGGAFAQSAREQSWYPRNFIAPKVRITGQTANQAEYGNLVEFMRLSQRKAIDWRKASPQENTTKFIIHSAGGHKYTRNGVTTVKHAHDPFIFFGHILNVTRNHERFQFAPEFQFEFVVAYSYSDVIPQGRAAPDTLRRLAPWMNKFKKEAAGDGYVYINSDSPLYQDDPDPYYGLGTADTVTSSTVVIPDIVMDQK